MWGQPPPAGGTGEPRRKRKEKGVGGEGTSVVDGADRGREEGQSEAGQPEGARAEAGQRPRVQAGGALAHGGFYECERRAGGAPESGPGPPPRLPIHPGLPEHEASLDLAAYLGDEQLLAELLQAPPPRAPKSASFAPYEAWARPYSAAGKEEPPRRGPPPCGHSALSLPPTGPMPALRALKVRGPVPICSATPTVPISFLPMVPVPPSMGL